MKNTNPSPEIKHIMRVAHTLEMENDFADSGQFADELGKLVLPQMIKIFQELIKKNGVPENNTGYKINILRMASGEIILCHLENGRFYPSVSSDWWEAKISSVDISDPDLGTKDPAEAMAWGLLDLITNLLLP